MDMNQTMYYGVHVPNTDTLGTPDNVCKQNVYFDKTEALKEVKKYKKARFKAFHFFHEALEFTQHGSECNIVSNPETNAVKTEVGEKPSQYRGPKSQDLVKLRKAIELGDVTFVRTTIWDNPRYLISNGDTPAILQEGSRYNALHVAAKAKNAQMCQLILSTVANPEFLQLVYGEENHINAEDASKILLDLYLNTPDKGLNETPLHFAVKFGALDVVETLVSYPICDKNVLNKYSHMPKDMVCNRICNPNPYLVAKIESLLEDQFYVPVLRSEDNCIQPVIGEPFSPASPPRLNTNPIDPRMEIHAYAGPMRKDEASVFHKKWKTPPRTIASFPGDQSMFESYKTDTDIRLQDNEKGLERVGRDLAALHNVGWKEYWPFLGSFADFRTRNGLLELESYLRDRFLRATQAIMSSPLHSDNSNQSPLSPITELCKRFGECSLNDNNNKTDALPATATSPCLCIEKSCQVLSNRIASYITNQMATGTVSQHNVDAFETEIKHLQSLIASFMDDPTFCHIINFKSVHSRIANITATKLKQGSLFRTELEDRCRSLKLLLQKYRATDAFSSDNEGPGRRRNGALSSDRKQMQCLVDRIVKLLAGDRYEDSTDYENVLSEHECVQLWNIAAPCDCIWKLNRNKKPSYNNKHPGNKGGLMTKSKLDEVSRRLMFFDDDDDYDASPIDIEPDTYFSLNNSEASDSESDDDASFKDADKNEYIVVYIDGNTATKMDYAVYNVLEKLPFTAEEFPYAYRWRHSMKMFPEDEKHRWPSPCISRVRAVSTPPTPQTDAKRHVYSSPQSWLRVTGQNSPMRSLKALNQCNLLYEY